MKRLIEDTLIKCGMPAGNCGFGYIVDAVLILAKEPRIKITAMYEAVASRNYTTATRAERGIRHAFLRTRECGDGELTRYYFGDSIANSDTLKTLLLRINRELEDMENEVHGE